MRFLLPVTVGMLLVSLTTPVASAHFGGGAYIIVPLDHVTPGQTFDVIGADLTPQARLSFRVVRDGEDFPLVSNVTTGADGHFSATVAVPSTYPNGYSLLV